MLKLEFNCYYYMSIYYFEKFSKFFSYLTQE